MAEPLSNAQELINQVLKQCGGNLPMENAIAMTQAYAAIAQAEQLKRIADRLDSVCATEGDFSVIRTASVRW